MCVVAARDAARSSGSFSSQLLKAWMWCSPACVWPNLVSIWLFASRATSTLENLRQN